MNGVLLIPIEDGKSIGELNYIWHDLIDGHRNVQLEEFWDKRLDND
jgi:hypothetical protein